MWSRSSVRPKAPSAPLSPAPSINRSAAPGTHAPFIGRSAETEAILRAVRHPIAAGAVVVGAPGSGKTSLLHHIQRSLADSYIVRVRGLPSAASFPYRALSFLLSEVPSASMHPALVVNAVARYLREEAGGRRIVLAVDNAEHLDESSSTLIGQLVAGRTASVILTVTDFAQADAAFMALWRTSALRRVELPPLSLEEARLFVESRLAGPASREVVDAVCAVGGGNPQAVRGALQAYTQRGLIARRGAAHVLLPGRPGTSQDVVAHTSVLRSLTAGQRAVVDLLALAGPLSWADLAEGTRPEDVDVLQDSGLLVIDSLSEPRASLATPGLAAAVAEVVGREEAADLLRRIERVPETRKRLHADPARHVEWLLRAGEPVSEERAVAALEALNRDGEHERAAHLAESVGVGASPQLAHQALVAALGLGRVKEAAEYAAVLSRSEDRLVAGEWTLHKIQESRLLRLGGSHGADAAEPLAEAERRLAVWRQDALAAGDPSRAAEFAALDRRVVLARAETASFQGRFHDSLKLLDEVGVDGALQDPGAPALRVAVQALALEANIVMNRQSMADTLAASLAGELARPGVDHRTADDALVRAGIAYIASGRISEGSQALADFAGSSYIWSFQRGSLAALGEALLLLMQDRVPEAVGVLTPAVEQLRITDPHGVLPIAASVLSYCAALTGTAEHSAGQVTPADADHGPWLVRRASEHYRLLAAARTGDRAHAALALQEHAGRDLEQGADAWALLSLGAAVRMGRQDAVPALRDLAGRLEGAMARALELYSGALMESDVEKLVAAMEAAAGMNNLRLVADIAQSGINATTRVQDKASLRLIQRRLRELTPEPAPAEAAASHLDLLTAREREVAVLAAAGRSNRAIATQMFVSVRTVEGHLYQVYSKLNVSSRAELADLIPAESAP